MKIARIAGLIACLLAGMMTDLWAQDTTWVQTLSFSDITKRRGTWVFPDGSTPHRKVLMYYTLKCDPATTQDGFDCGEWDYLTYTMLYDHKGLMDSTYQETTSFAVNGQRPDSVQISWDETYDQWRSFLHFVTHTDTTSLNVGSPGTATTTLSHPLNTPQGSGRGQYLYTAAELATAGISAGDITGLRLDFSSVGSDIRHLRIKMKHTALTALSPTAYEDGLQEVYHFNETIPATGSHSFQFPTPFTWNGTDNVVVEFSFEGPSGGAGHVLSGQVAPFGAGLYTAGRDFCMNFAGGGRYVNLGPGPQQAGNAPRTIEAWAYTRSFNSGGIFQAGPTGTVGKDFSLRTMGTTDLWRVQCWGPPDFDATLAGSANSWHHFAVTYDGSTTRLYYDGQFVTQESYNLNTGDFDIWLGRWSGSWFNGLIDEVRVWNTALSQPTLEAWMGRDVDAGHPQYANLVGYYPMNEGSGISVGDVSPANQAAGGMIGIPWWQAITGQELFRNWTATAERPVLTFEQGVFTTVLDSVAVLDTVARQPLVIQRFDNPAGGVKIEDNSPVHPSLPTDTVVAWAGDTWSYVYDQTTGMAIDSVWIGADTTWMNQDKFWYSPLVIYEIGRFITPYGIGLDLGPQGFTWIYDITDYEPLFRDSVELSAGNQQELIDLRFAFIEGTPPRPVKRLNKIWGTRASYSYRAMDDDDVLFDTTVAVDTSAAYFKVKTRLTGHGHNSNTGNYPHCCEWKDNEHSLFVDGSLAASWHIWQDPECAQNPVYPQGGTWLGSREGWCPGELVKDREIDITSHVSGATVHLDYDITDVPANNLGMGNGNYVVGMHMVQYGPAAHSLDAEVYDVIRPNDWEYYSRVNPICQEPEIILRNSGTDTLTSLTIQYGISGGILDTYQWAGSLAFMDTLHLSLPIYGATFWNGNTDNEFIVMISNPNGGQDQYADNDQYTTTFVRPDTLPPVFTIFMQTNTLPQENRYELRDIYGNLMFSRDNLAAQWIYQDTMYLPNGCYTFTVWDEGRDGMSYWAYPQQGNGFIRFNPVPLGPSLVVLEAEFGYKQQYTFVVDNVVNVPVAQTEPGILVYPNPSKGLFRVELQGMQGQSRLQVMDAMGRVVRDHSLEVNGFAVTELDLRQAGSGVYFVQVTTGTQRWTRRVVVE